MADRYWVGGSGNWSDTAHWSTSSGGSGGASLPDGLSDRVFFDANSTGTCTLDTTGNCYGLDCTGHTGTITGASYLLGANGNVTLGSGGTYSGLILSINLSDNYSITCNGKSLSWLAATSSDIYGSKTLTCNDAINVGTLTINSDTTASVTIKLKSGVTSYCTSTATNPISTGTNYLQSSTAGVQATLSDSSGTNTLTDITVQDIAFTGGATWLGGTNSFDAGNNTGITGLTTIGGGTSIPALFLHSLA